MCKDLTYGQLVYFFQIVVLLVGTNNIKNSAEEVAEGLFEIVKNIRERLPDAYIVLPVMKETSSNLPNSVS